MLKRTFKIFKAVKTKGRASKLLEERVLQTSRYYDRLSVRQLFYRLTSKYGYSANRRFYKLLVYHLCKLRRRFSELDVKFVDPTRPFISAPMYYGPVEVWCEKDSIAILLQELAKKHRLSVQSLRGFGSLSMFRRALQRASRRGIQMVLYVGDHDPSGLDIQRIAEREMPLEVKRIALTREQIKRFRPPALPIKKRDSRSKDYRIRYGDKGWEVESLRPTTLLRLVEEELRKYVPSEYLAKAKEQAVSVSKPLVRRLTREIYSEVLRLMQAGENEEDIVRRLALRYDIQLGKQQQGDENIGEKSEIPH